MFNYAKERFMDQLYKKIGKMNFKQGNIHADLLAWQHTDKHNTA